MAKSQKAPEVAKSNISSIKTPGLKILVGLFLLTCLVYSNTLGHEFVLDDPLSIGLNKNVTSGISGIVDIITGGYRENNFGGQLYRPISLIQFAIEWQISPNNPFIHHLFNVLWYAITVCLIFITVRKWMPEKSIIIPVVIAAIFAIHPIHTEVVANIKSRDEIMSLFFIVSSMLAWDKYMTNGKTSWLVTTLGLYFLALMSKETAITMFPVFGMIAFWIYRQNLVDSLKKAWVFIIPVILLFMIRYILFNGQDTPIVSYMDNPIVNAENIIVRFATAFVILWKYLSLLFVPYPLSSDYSYTVIPLVGFGDLSVWWSILVHLALLTYAILKTKSRDIIALCIWCYFFAISLFSQIPIVIGTMFGERLIYMASFWWIIGFILALDQLFTTYFKSANARAMIGFSVIVGSVFAILTFVRNEAWSDNLTLFTTDAATYPTSVRLNNGAAETMLKMAVLPENEGKKDAMMAKSEAYCQQIMKVKPVPTAYLTLGNIRLHQKNYEEAIKYYDQVNDLQSIVDANKALAYREMGRKAGETEHNIEKSQNLLNQSLALNEKDAETYFLLGVSYGVSGNHQMAGEKFEKAYSINPTPEYAKNMLMAFQNAGNQEKLAAYQNLMTK